jgi:CheY-like chemotaxis protein
VNVANENALNFKNEDHANAAALFAGPGEVRSHARELDWSKSPLGPTTNWSPALRTIVRTIFDSPFPICLWSGPHYALVYNDPYRRILAAKHPAALGRSGSSVWAEIWEELQPQFDGVRKGGDKILLSDVRIDLLVTDVGLPGGMNGRQMADAGRVSRPDLKVLFITGYAENAAVGNGQLAPGMALLTKPFPVEEMAARIRSMIEAGKKQ